MRRSVLNIRKQSLLRRSCWACKATFNCTNATTGISGDYIPVFSSPVRYTMNAMTSTATFFQVGDLITVQMTIFCLTTPNGAGVNSINWARIMAQSVYYFYAAIALGAPHREVAFSVPTGNFGDIFAGYVARRMGLPITRLIIATNVNDILVRTLKTSRYEITPVAPTSSPAMDIQVSSNFERLLFDVYERDASSLCALMDNLSQSGCFQVSENALGQIQREFSTCRVDEDLTRGTIKAVYKKSGRLVDPHTAVGIAAAEQERTAGHIPLVTLATAHPAKFPDAVVDATGIQPSPPARLADLLQREERYDVLPGDLDIVKAYILQRSQVAN